MIGWDPLWSIPLGVLFYWVISTGHNAGRHAIYEARIRREKERT